MGVFSFDSMNTKRIKLNWQSFDKCLNVFFCHIVWFTQVYFFWSPIPCSCGITNKGSLSNCCFTTFFQFSICSGSCLCNVYIWVQLSYLCRVIFDINSFPDVTQFNTSIQLIDWKLVKFFLDWFCANFITDFCVI